MGFGRRKKDYSSNNYKPKGSARPKLAIAGAISLVVGALLIHYYGVPLLMSNRTADNPLLIAGMIGVLVGALMLFFSLSKRNQRRFAKGIDDTRKAFADSCQCCKCQNCGRSHNHWVHDDNDTKRRHF